MTGRRAAFIDRDGVINVDKGHVHLVDDFEFIPGAVAGLRRLAEAGWLLVVVTNQAGLAKGYYTLAQYERLTAHLRAALAMRGVPLAGVYHCPHHPQGVVPVLRLACTCRKPGPGLLLQAAADLGIDLAASAIVGDKPSDVQAGLAAGVGRRVLVRSGHALPPGAEREADLVVDDLNQAALCLTARAADELRVF